MSLVTLLAACGEVSTDSPAGAPVAWADLVAACPGDPEVGPSWPLSEAGSLVAIGEDCAARVVEAFGVDAASFDEESLTTVVGGLLVATRSGEATVGELGATGVPAGLAAELQDRAEGLDPGDPAGAAWYALLATHIRRVVADPGISTDGTRMSWDDGTVTVGDLVGNEDTAPHPPPVDALEAAGIFVHEAGHAFLDAAHVACADGDPDGCDADAEGAYAAGIWWTWTWLRPAEASGSSALCVKGIADIGATCGNILEPGDYPPCAEGAGDVCD